MGRALLQFWGVTGGEILGLYIYYMSQDEPLQGNGVTLSGHIQSDCTVPITSLAPSSTLRI